MKTRMVLIAAMIWALPASVFAADFFRIASFNVEHLGSRTPGQRPIAIAEHIDLSGANAIALQEIYVTNEISDNASTPFDESRRSTELDTAFAILNQEGDTDWKYELFPNRNPNDKSQLCGIAWNAKVVERKEAAFPINITGPNPNKIWDRRPHAVKLSYVGGKTDIVFIPIHMKSNYGSAANGRDKRKQEAETLVSQLGNVSAHFGGEKDIIIGGDTNFLKADEDAGNLITAAGYRYTNSLDYPTYICYGNGAPFDRFFLAN